MVNHNYYKTLSTMTMMLTYSAHALPANLGRLCCAGEASCRCFRACVRRGSGSMTAELLETMDGSRSSRFQTQLFGKGFRSNCSYDMTDRSFAERCHHLYGIVVTLDHR
jgi:hypothetical protein